MSAPRRAATLLILRPAASPSPAGEVEVLLVRRSRAATFMANAYVFPGGRVDEADAALGAGLATRVCAAREALEEVGVRLPDPAALPLFARWITPSVEPKRFDTDFFLAALPGGEVPRVDEQEVFDLQWLTPGEALSRYAQGALNLPPPTMSTLEELELEIGRLGAGAQAQGGVLPGLLAACAARRPVPILPKLVPAEGGGVAIVMPWAEEYPGLPGDGEPVPRTGRSARCVLSPDGRWRAS